MNMYLEINTLIPSNEDLARGVCHHWINDIVTWRRMMALKTDVSIPKTIVWELLLQDVWINVKLFERERYAHG